MYKAVRTIYCKGDGIPVPGCVSLPNVGRESHTYLHHVVSRYESLANWTVFSQAEVPRVGYAGHESFRSGHMVDGVTFHDYVLGDGPFSGSEDSRFILNGAIRVHGGSLWHKLSDKYETASAGGSGIRVREVCQIHTVEMIPDNAFLDFQTFLAGKCFGNDTTQVAQHVKDYATMDLGIPLGDDYDTLYFSQGARFAVSRERIRQRPKAFYQHLLEMVSMDESPCAGFFNEWLWYYIFGLPSHSPC